MEQNKHIAIVGAGLSGLTLAYLLYQENISFTILEASPRIGGRIQTMKGINGTPLELGATWFSDSHSYLNALLNELDLEKFIQYTEGKSIIQTHPSLPPEEFIVPNSESPSYRIADGTQSIINTLQAKIDEKQIILNSKIISIQESENKMILESSTGDKYTTDLVVLCIPPQIVHSSISFTPELETSITDLLPNVQTWMAGSIKFALEYSEAFWRKKGYSGMIFSQSGIVAEMYDHTNFDENRFGFTGFLNNGSKQYNHETRKSIVLDQLKQLLGEQAASPLSYHDKVWDDEFILDGNHIIGFPHENNGNQLLQKNYMNNKLFFSATESSIAYSGSVSYTHLTLPTKRIV